MIPNGKEIIIDGHKVVFESTTYQCRGCFFENRDSCPDCDEGIWVEEGSPWHTGTPTEEGWYLVVLPICEQVYRYESDYFNKAGKWRLYTNQVIAWRKIEPFEETD